MLDYQQWKIFRPVEHPLFIYFFKSVTNNSTNFSCCYWSFLGTCESTYCFTLLSERQMLQSEILQSKNTSGTAQSVCRVRLFAAGAKNTSYLSRPNHLWLLPFQSGPEENVNIKSITAFILSIFVCISVCRQKGCLNDRFTFTSCRFPSGVQAYKPNYRNHKSKSKKYVFINYQKNICI